VGGVVVWLAGHAHLSCLNLRQWITIGVDIQSFIIQSRVQTITQTGAPKLVILGTTQHAWEHLSQVCCSVYSCGHTASQYDIIIWCAAGSPEHMRDILSVKQQLLRSALTTLGSKAPNSARQ
jgi:hypothetical protein